MSNFEKERNNFEKIFGNKLQYETLLGLYCYYDTARTWNGWYKCAKMKDAEITRLRAEIDLKNEALKPFAAFADDMKYMGGTFPKSGAVYSLRVRDEPTDLTVENFNRAKQALQNNEENK